MHTTAWGISYLKRNLMIFVFTPSLMSNLCVQWRCLLRLSYILLYFALFVTIHVIRCCIYTILHIIRAPIRKKCIQFKNKNWFRIRKKFAQVINRTQLHITCNKFTAHACPYYLNYDYLNFYCIFFFCHSSSLLEIISSQNIQRQQLF